MSLLPQYDATPTSVPYKKLHCDPHLLVVSKPSRLLSVPGRGEEKQDCLISRVQTEHADALIVHRLDFDTSGLIVLARNKEIHRALSILFQDRRVEKKYVAIIDGYLKEQEGTVDLPLLVDWPNRPLHRVDFENGKPSQTYFERVSYNDEDDTTRVDLYPQTGRTHQLRVHMQAIGHTIIGDPLYATPTAFEKASRLLLHAETLSFTHPVTGELMTFEDKPEF